MTLEALQQTLGYSFHDVRLLRLALTHRSLVREGIDSSNQRLEFLGDSVLGLVIAEMLYGIYPTEAEGDLSKRLVSLVNGEQLAGIARTMSLGEAPQRSSGEEGRGGPEDTSNLEDACEALLGAVYLDGGIDAARAVVAKFWSAQAQAMVTPPKDAKTSLQEWAQARGLSLPEYALSRAEGPSHAPLFIIEVRVEGLGPIRAEAGVKKIAERLAAEKLLATLA